MLRHYFKIAWRSLIKYRFFSIVNILGLVAGLTFTLLIGAYVYNELQVNKSLRNSEKQYILKTVSRDANVGYELATFGPLAKRLYEDYPSLVANYYRWDGITSVISKADKHFREGLQVGDSTLLDMYGFKLLHGNPKTALVEPFSLVITTEKAIKYFGKTNVVGESLSIQNFSGGHHDFTITGVLQQVPENSITHLVKNYPNSFFIPTNTLSYFNRLDIDSWQNMFIASYVELKDGVRPEDLEKPIHNLLAENASPVLKSVITVQPVLLHHYYLTKDNGLIKRMTYTLSFAGIIILLMALVNFINISISRSAVRMREIGVRKVLGSPRHQLILQFLSESFIVVMVAMLISLLLYSILRPLFGQLVDTNLPNLMSFPIQFGWIILGFAIFTSFLAGIYPAWVLSALKTVNSLKGKLNASNENIVMRKSLVVFQFSIAIIVLVSSFVISRQISHFFGQSLGYDKEYVVSAQVPRDWSKEGARKMEIIRNEFMSLPEVNNTSLSYEIPDGNNAGQVAVYRFGSDSTSATFLQLLQTDENYISTYQIPIISGSFFDSKGLDSGKVVINEEALATLGFQDPTAAIGQRVRIPGDPTIFTIKGVVKDFQFGSMQKAIPPMLFFNVQNSPFFRYLSFKLKPGNLTSSLNDIGKKWSDLLPGSSFEYRFMDETLSSLYATEIRLKKASFTATILSIIIALLGIMGLITMNLQKRKKEIGIRKVLGASVRSILGLFVGEFSLVLGISALVGAPLAYWIMYHWLENYASHISISWFILLASIGLIGMLVLLVVCLQAARSATANPVKSLRTE